MPIGSLAVICVLKQRIRLAVNDRYVDMAEETLDRFIDLWCEQHPNQAVITPAQGLENQLVLIEMLGGEAALSEALNAVLGLPHCLGEDAKP